MRGNIPGNQMLLPCADRPKGIQVRGFTNLEERRLKAIYAGCLPDFRPVQGVEGTRTGEKLLICKDISKNQYFYFNLNPAMEHNYRDPVGPFDTSKRAAKHALDNFTAMKEE